MKKKTIDILDILPQECFEAIDKHAYDFLKEQGYDTEGAAESAEKRRELLKKLYADKKNLYYHGAIDPDTGAILVWFELRSKGKTIAKSKGIKFLPKKKEVQDG